MPSTCSHSKNTIKYRANSTPGFIRGSRSWLILFLFIQWLVPQTASAICQDVLFPNQTEPGFFSLCAEVKDPIILEAQVGFRCPVGQSIDQITYSEPTWKTPGDSVAVPLSPEPTVQKTFTLPFPPLPPHVCPIGEQDEPLKPSLVLLSARCSKLGDLSPSYWIAYAEIDTEIVCNGNEPESLHEPTIRVDEPPDDQPTPHYASAFAANLFDDEPGTDNEPGIGVRLGYGLGRGYSLELGILQQKSTLQDLDGNITTGNIFTLDLHAAYGREINDCARWLVLGGIGWRFADLENQQGQDLDLLYPGFADGSFVPSVGLGLELQLSDNFWIDTRLLGRFNSGPTGEEWTTEGQIGLKYRFDLR